ncbi:hypothetical protein GH714_021865 [Hevea brasiliensis]|uniref:Protein kinase domain-containing protein n=1 Tax=Hevea brasiliensis TaxID=3981 RepID=A0A6A6LCN0_HEVBR|nr:hypothetical protein GH714_021865 [Hevea brasiliensis]
MEGIATQLRRGISRQFSTGSLRRTLSRQFSRQTSLDPRRNNLRGDVKGVEDLLNEGIDVNSIDLDGRTALHIAACEGHLEACADAKYYGNEEIYNVLKARGAKAPKTRKTPMAVTNPREVPEYELNPLELQVRKSDGISKGSYQVAKWNGTKVTVKILDKDSYSDPESMGMNYLHECKPDPIIHCVLKPKNILLDSGGLLKVAGFGLIKLSKISPDKAKVAPGIPIDPSNIYVAPEVYKDEIFDRSVDTYSFGVILYEMIEGVLPFHPKSPEEAVKLMCLEKQRPFKTKSRSIL